MGILSLATMQIKISSWLPNLNCGYKLFFWFNRKQFLTIVKFQWKNKVSLSKSNIVNL
jgi:hypothetical protein